jgi:hypothetical protein
MLNMTLSGRCILRIAALRESGANNVRASRKQGHFAAV